VFEIDEELEATAATFAHYTFWEFLESERIKVGPAAFFAIDREMAALQYSKLVITEATNFQSIQATQQILDQIFDQEDHEYRGSIYDFFGIYCVASPMLCVRALCPIPTEADSLDTLAIELLDVSKPHFGFLEKIAKTGETGHVWDMGLSSTNDSFHRNFWLTRWEDLQHTCDVRTLSNLAWADRTLELATRFLSSKSKTQQKLFSNNKFA